MVVDIIIIVILALSIFFGYKKGLVELGNRFMCGNYSYSGGFNFI